MKRLLTLQLALLCAFSCCLLGAQARTGDVSGSVYATDIRAFINGVEVPSYNIGGRTAIALEEVLTPDGYAYDNGLRTLLVHGFDPAYLRGGSSKSAGTIGQAVGRTYETDIKAYVFSELLQSWNIGGQTAVAIEDLGGDGVFNAIGGRYHWNAQERTISLDFLYDNGISELKRVLDERGLRADLVVNNGEVTLGEGLGGFGLSQHWDGDTAGRVIPLTLNGAPVGHYVSGESLCFAIGDDGSVRLEKTDTARMYFDTAAFAAAVENAEQPQLTRERVIEYYHVSCLAEDILRTDTEDYSFLYMYQPTPHGRNEMLLLVRADGSYHDYAHDIDSGSFWGRRIFSDVTLDEATETVRFRYEKEYVLSLRTGELSERK